MSAGEGVDSLSIPKYRKIVESLKADILSGRYAAGQKLPSEAVLVRKSGASRITVGRALKELQNLGLVHRVAGSGTFARANEPNQQGLLFGLLIPDLGETEILEPSCQGIANAPEAAEHACSGGTLIKAPIRPEQAWHLCRRYLEKRVAGVFLAPLEFQADSEKVTGAFSVRTQRGQYSGRFIGPAQQENSRTKSPGHGRN